jgi:hypothetical protein
MSKLQELVTELKTILKKDTDYFRRDIINLIREYDSTLLKDIAEQGSAQSKRLPRPTLEARKLRKQFPGKYEVVFVNKHTKEQQRMTKEGGVPYDVALIYFNYVTDYNTDTINEQGHYELKEYDEEGRFKLIEEDYLGM